MGGGGGGRKGNDVRGTKIIERKRGGKKKIEEWNKNEGETINKHTNLKEIST